MISNLWPNGSRGVPQRVDVRAADRLGGRAALRWDGPDRRPALIVSGETVRRWCAKFGQAYANGLRRRRPRPGDKWHLDEVFVRISVSI